jgi:hypothetical protein
MERRRALKETAMEEQAQQKNMKTVWTMTERTTASAGTRTYWTRVGVGFVNRDGSITLRLDAVPISGQLQVREWEPAERRPDGGDTQARGRPRPSQAPLGPSVDSLL